MLAQVECGVTTPSSTYPIPVYYPQTMTSATGTTRSIASLYSTCIRSFNLLCDFLEDSDNEFSGQISILGIQDELGRFRVWAGNVGAHRSGRVSLDHKLRESSQIHAKVSELLTDLDESLAESKSPNPIRAIYLSSIY